MPVTLPLGRRNSGFVPLDDIPHSDTMEWNEMSTFARPGKTISPPQPRRPLPSVPNPVTTSPSPKSTFNLESDLASSPAAFAEMDPKNKPRNIQVLFHYTKTEKYPSWNELQSKIDTEIARPDLSHSHLSQATTAHDDTASILTLSTIDGLADHASEISHPCTITPMLPTTQHTYITEPAATYQPSARYPPLPGRPQPHNVMSRWLGRELLDMERQQELQVKREQAAVKRNNRIRMAVRAGFVVFAIASGIVLMVLGGCYNSPGVHNALVGTSIGFIGVAIVGTVLAVCELGNMKHGDRS